MFIEHLSAHLKHQMCAFLSPLHLLLFGNPFTYDLVDCRFHKARGYSVLIAPRFAVIWNECLVDNDIRVELVERFSELLTTLAGNATVVLNAVQLLLAVPDSNVHHAQGPSHSSQRPGRS